VGRLKLNLDISHGWRGDLVVQLTSPTGRTVDVFNRVGGGGKGIEGTVDLSTFFQGEPLMGDWTLSVRDSAKCDEGTLHAWGLEIGLS
jgi:subtilisin-like proprotein convertase family protein